jgi:phage-related protein
MSEKKYRHIVLFKDYFIDFYNKQNNKVKDKIIWTFRIVETFRIVPAEYLKYIEDTDGLYEIRVQFGSNIYRIFCFFDTGNLVVIANGFQKKSQKTSKQEIELAHRIKKEYEQEKRNRDGK